ncbi:MAG: aldo/keto reductase [Geminicoccaceae bacterium]|nr:aldo/keto reductase [Geminicoccaceae bacterium]
MTAPKGRLEAAGLELSRLGLGGTPFGGLHEANTDAAVAATVTAALDQGVRYLDTAPFYGFGLAEHRLGRALQDVPRERYVLSTKVGRLLRPRRGPAPDIAPFAESLPFEAVFDYSYDGTMRSLEDSRQRLDLAAIDIALIHDLSPRWHGADLPRRLDEAMAGAYRALDELRNSGDIKAIGVGVNDSRACLDLAARGRFDCFMLAGRYTLLDHTALKDFLPYCAAEGIGVLLAGPFNSGILATGAKAGATFFYAPADTEIVERTSRIEAICAAHNVPLAAAALQFSASHPAIASVVTGCRSATEVERNLALMALPIPPALWQELATAGLIARETPLTL